MVQTADSLLSFLETSVTGDREMMETLAKAQSVECTVHEDEECSSKCYGIHCCKEKGVELPPSLQGQE
jgi:hypothetical protein